MANMEYLGFVIRHDAKDPGSVVAGCVAKLTDRGQVVWRAYPPTDQKLIPMLFVTSVAIKQKLAEYTNVEDGAPAGKILLRKPDPRFDFILNHLYDVGSKPGSYRSLPDDLRKAARFFFVLYGEKATVQLQAPQGGLRPQQIFFWTVSDFLRQTRETSLPTEPTNIQVETDPPQSNPNIAMRVPILADTVRLHLAQPEPWYELYRQAVKAPEDLPTHTIAVCGSEVCSTQEKEERLLHREHHLQLSQMIARHPKILLTGPSGSGKTTLLKMLMADLLRSRPSNQNYLPVFVSMKYIGLRGKGLTDLIVDTVVEAIMSAKRSTIQQQTDIRRAHGGDIGNAESLLASEVREFLKSGIKKGESNIVLLLDGYNEIPEADDPATEQELLTLAERVDNIIISSHSSSTPRIPLGFTHFELEELSDEQIILYANAHLDGTGRQFFDNEIAPNGRVLSMARTAGHLELIVQYRMVYPDRRIPTCLGPLLEFFSQQQYEEKRQTRKLQVPDVTDPDIDFFLRKLAHALIDKGEERGRTVVSYPDDLRPIFPSSSLRELSTLVRAGQLLGFIDESGSVHDKTGAGTTVGFRHDNIRHYFAARELREQGVVNNPALIKSYLEYTKWDGVWLMLFGIIDRDDVFEKALLEISAYDPSFAADCLLSYPRAKRKHADGLLGLFSLERLHMLLPINSGDNVDRLHWPQVDETPIGPALSKILSTCGSSRLLQLYKAPATDPIIKDAIPAALVLAQGAEALPHLATMIHSEGLDALYSLFAALTATNSPEALEILVEYYLHVPVTAELTRGRWSLFFIRSYVARLLAKCPLSRLIDLAVRCYEAIQHDSKDSPHRSALLGELLETLAWGDVGTSDEWLSLLNHPIEEIASAAREALLYEGHPIIAEQVAAKWLRPDCYRPEQYESGEFHALMIGKGLDGEQILVDLLYRAAAHYSMSLSPFSDIPFLLVETANPTTMRKLVRFCLHENHPMAIEAMEPLSSVPGPTIRAIDEELITTTVSREEQRRAGILRMLCSPRDAEDELITCAVDLLAKWRRGVESTGPVRDSEASLFRIISWSLAGIPSPKWQAILQGCEAATPPRGVRSLVHELVTDTEEPDENTPVWNPRSLVTALRKERHLDLNLDIMLSDIELWHQGDIRTLAVSLLRDFRFAVSSRMYDKTRLLYYIIEKVRACLPSVRMLDLLAGWPCSLPKKGKASETKETGSRRPSKRKKP